MNSEIIQVVVDSMSPEMLCDTVTTLELVTADAIEVSISATPDDIVALDLPIVSEVPMCDLVNVSDVPSKIPECVHPVIDNHVTAFLMSIMAKVGTGLGRKRRRTFLSNMRSVCIDFGLDPQAYGIGAMGTGMIGQSTLSKCSEDGGRPAKKVKVSHPKQHSPTPRLIPMAAQTTVNDQPGTSHANQVTPQQDHLQSLDDFKELRSSIIVKQRKYAKLLRVLDRCNPTK